MPYMPADRKLPHIRHLFYLHKCFCFFAAVPEETEGCFYLSSRS